ncbi:PAS domain S-box protein [Stappia sp. MMSF_3263]|uniref:PAS domain S-box protein n=1 Tax=Stappia sp. MMSF_3263 TaxID=3046693 RepID=UPI00273DAC15|nr:PAS domain S-box protein [Stappia sp. MMSF_3263]
MNLSLPVLAALTALVLVWFIGCLAVLVAQNRRWQGSMARAADELGREQRRAARLAALNEQLGGALISCDANGLVESANAQARQLFGMSREAFAGRPLAAIFPELRYDWPATGAESADGEGAGVRLETTGVRADGWSFPAEIRVSRIDASASGAKALLVTDMTGQVATSTRLREAQIRLRDAIEALPDAFVLYDAQDRLVLCNRRYRELYTLSGAIIRPGITFEEIIRKGIELGQYEDARDDPEGWLAERLRLHREPPHEPIEQKLGNGRWLRVFERRMRDGQTVGFRIDITELKRREQALRVSEGRLAGIVDGALDAIVVTDGEGLVTEFNPAAERVLGRKREAVLGRSLWETLVPPNQRAGFETQLARLGGDTLPSHGGVRFEMPARRADGAEFAMDVAVSRVDGADGPQYVAFMRDITDERAKTLALEDALSRAEDADRAKSDFLAMMSHEIRTPLHAVLGLLDLIAHTGLTARQRDYTRTAQDAALALLQILNDILDFSRLEARRLEFVREPFDPRAVVEAVRALFAPQAAERRLDFTASVQEVVPQAVIGDAGRVRQVLINLVANAMKWTEEGSVSIDLSLLAEISGDPGPARLRFTVEDTGPGIGEEERERIFSRFTTMQVGGGGRVEGVGLGLAICRELVDGMGGRIEVVPGAAGQGSRFLVDLDLEIASGVASEVGGPAASLEGLRVVLAEDNPTNRMMAGEMLVRWGCSHVEATSGEAVLDLLETGPFDLVLMDLSMPEMDGVEATRRIRASARPYADIPVVALTAHALVAERDRALAAGMSAFVTKPVDAAVLQRAMVDAVAGTSPAAAVQAVEDATEPDYLADLSDDVRARVTERCRVDLVEHAARLDAAGGSAEALGRSAHVLAALTETFGLPLLARRARQVEADVLSGRIGEGAAVDTNAAELAQLAREAARGLASK